MTYLEIALVAVCVYLVLVPPKYDPAIRLKEWMRRPQEIDDTYEERVTNTGFGLVETSTIEAYYLRQIEWSRETFGPAPRTKGIIDHITKELREIEDMPNDLSEWIDVVILAMDGFWRHGGRARDLMPALLAKQKKNMARTWPDWRTVGEDKAIEHDRT